MPTTSIEITKFELMLFEQLLNAQGDPVPIKRILDIALDRGFKRCSQKSIKVKVNLLRAKLRDHGLMIPNSRYFHGYALLLPKDESKVCAA